MPRWHGRCLSIATNLFVGISIVDTTWQLELICAMFILDFAILDHMAFLLNLWYAGQIGQHQSTIVDTMPLWKRCDPIYSEKKTPFT